MGKRHDYRPALKQVQARVLVIHGEGDMVPERISRMYADCLPNSQLHVMRNSQTRVGHFPFREQSDTFAAIIGDFLAGKE
jgi:pimeloyl-ACP methyl ester carboxylesterase